MIRRLALVLLLALVASPGSGAGADPAGGPRPDPRTVLIDEIMNRTVQPDGPGAAVAVVLAGEVLHMKGYGRADLDRAELISPLTVFDLASVSKQFTAMAVLILAECGQLGLADDVRKYLPELPPYDPKRPIRVTDLLHMTSGLPEYFPLLDRLPEPSRLTCAELLDWLKTQKLESPTGTRFAYTNTNYALLTYVVERVSQRSLGQFLRAQVFEPLGMRHTLFFEDPKTAIARRATGYAVEVKGWRRSQDDVPGVGDGNVFSTVEDLVLWDRGLRQGRLVKPETLDLAFTSGKLDSGAEHGYGCGWTVSGHGSGRVVQHAGEWYGTSTYIGRWLDTALTVIVLSNNEDLDVDQLGRAIAEAVLPQGGAPAGKGN